MSEVKIVEENSIVVQSSELIEANYKLSIAEQKLILALCSQIDTRKQDFEVVRITAKSLTDICKFTSKNNYAQLQQIIKKILNRSLIIKKRDGSGWYGTHWVQYCEYVSSRENDTDTSYIEVEFDKRLCPHLLKLGNRFLKTNLSQLVSFSHIYSTRFYMIFRNLVNNLPQCQKKYTFSEIVKLLELPKTYEKSTINLKYKVIKTAVDEINEKSDIVVEYEYYSEGGRAHIGVIFTFSKKTDKKEASPPALVEPTNQPLQLTSSAIDATSAEPHEPADYSEGIALIKSVGVNPPSSSTRNEKKEKSASVTTVNKVKKTERVDEGNGTNFTEEQQADYDALINNGVWAQTARKFVMICDHEQIERNLKGVLMSKPKGNIKDVGAVITNAIFNDTYEVEFEERQKAMDREIERKKAEWEEKERIEKEQEEKRKKETEEYKKLADIRSKKTREDLIKIFEEVMNEYNNNNEKFNDEMIKKLKENGIPTTDLVLYRSETLREIISYLK